MSLLPVYQPPTLWNPNFRDSVLGVKKELGVGDENLSFLLAIVLAGVDGWTSSKGVEHCEQDGPGSPTVCENLSKHVLGRIGGKMEWVSLYWDTLTMYSWLNTTPCSWSKWLPNLGPG